MKPILLLLSALFCFHLSEAQQYNYHSKINPDTSIFNGFFGHDLEIEGDNLYVSYAQSPVKNQMGNYTYQSGKIEIFKRTGKHWSQQNKIIPAQPDSIRLFGLYMAVEDTTVAVLAYNLHGQESLEEDSVSYLELQIFNLRNDQWTHKQSIDITPYSKSAVHSLALHRNTIVVGSGHETVSGNENAGKIYVFEKNSTWELSQEISNPNPAANDYFGNAIDLNDNFIVAAAFGRNVDNKTSAGSVYTFKKGSSNWNYHKTILSGNISDNAFFGTAVLIEENTVLVGAFKEQYDQNNKNRLTDAGAAYIYNLENNFWVLKQKITPNTRAKNSYFGYAMCILDNQIAISAYSETEKDSNNLPMRAGAVYIFKKENTNWQEMQRLTSPVIFSDLFIGRSLDMSDSFLAIGAPYDRTDTNWVFNGNARSGSVLMFNLSRGTASIGELHDLHFSIYPNPTNGEIHMFNPLNKELQFEIYNATGQIVRTGTLSGGEHIKLNLPEQPGVYVLHIQIGQERINKKLIKL
ncbi:T9SS type A sorting domain-containing protein [bacterium]|nr:T9SS type A sorting domain-containing protein [bacterium]